MLSRGTLTANYPLNSFHISHTQKGALLTYGSHRESNESWTYGAHCMHFVQNYYETNNNILLYIKLLLTWLRTIPLDCLTVFWNISPAIWVPLTPPLTRLMAGLTIVCVNIWPALTNGLLVCCCMHNWGRIINAMALCSQINICVDFMAFALFVIILLWHC